MDPIKIKSFCLGMWMTNSYLIYRAGDENCLIIDAGFAPGEMIEEIKRMKLKPEMLIYTHAHLDHIAGTGDIKTAFPDITTAVSEAEADFLTEPSLNLSSNMGMEIKVPPADLLLKDEQELRFGDLVFRVLCTPGHSPGGICLYQKENAVLMSGDTLFAGSVGRYDFPTSDGDKLFRSIKEKLMSLPDETVVYPGHGGETTIGRERKKNPFLR